jgi:RHS repeat-associated protein
VSGGSSTNKVAIAVLACFILGLGILTVKNRRSAVILLLSISLIIVPGTPYAASGIVSVNNNIKNPYGFTGEQQFREADGLIFLRARYYDPRIGRFISRDPILKPMIRNGGSFWVSPNLVRFPQLLHPYVYAYNNPINYTDPTGKMAEAIALGLTISTPPGWVVTAVIGTIAIGGVIYYVWTQRLIETTGVPCPPPQRVPPRPHPCAALCIGCFARGYLPSWKRIPLCLACFVCLGGALIGL